MDKSPSQEIYYCLTEEIYNSLSVKIQKIQLFLCCQSLNNLCVLSKSDPYFKVFLKLDFSYKQFSQLGHNQAHQNNLNPNFKQTFTIDYIFQSRQDIKFQVYYKDENGNNDDYIGYVETTVGALMGAKNQTSIIDIKSPKGGAISQGKMVVRCGKIEEYNQYVHMSFQGEKLHNFDFWNMSNPYIKFMKIRDNNSFIKVHKTEVIKNNLNPIWKPLEIQAAMLINLNKNSFKVQVWDWQQKGKLHKFIGQCFIVMINIKSGLRLELVNPDIKEPGHLILREYQLIKKPSFTDYLRGGLQLNMIVAVDFTATNGNPTNNNSLHYNMDPMQPNQYQKAILGITNILMNYDFDKQIPCFGFGGIPHFNGVQACVNHCFALSGNPAKLQAYGVDDLMTLYKHALPKVHLFRPNNFADIITKTINIATQCKKSFSDKYQTLLILTDGQIQDLNPTINCIIQAATLPLSIIIVGVGHANFDNIKQLLGDKGLYNKQGAKAARDIVQFVAFRDAEFNPDKLAKKLLAKLPQQVLQYMNMMGLSPGKIVIPDLVHGGMQNPQQQQQQQQPQSAIIIEGAND